MVKKYIPGIAVCDVCVQSSGVVITLWDGTFQLILVIGRLPLDPRLSECLEQGQSFVEKYPGSAAQQEMAKIVTKLPGQSVPR